MPLPIFMADGTFLNDNGEYSVEVDGKVQHVNPVLELLVGWEEANAVLSHLPAMPPRNEWGFGCCRWVQVGSCPFGHHLEPFRLYHRQFRGKLQRDGGGPWVIGGEPLFDLPALEGHVCRVILSPSKWDLSRFQVEGGQEAIAELSRLLAAFRSQ